MYWNIVSKWRSVLEFLKNKGMHKQIFQNEETWFQNEGMYWWILNRMFGNCMVRTQLFCVDVVCGGDDDHYISSQNRRKKQSHGKRVQYLEEDESEEQSIKKALQNPLEPEELFNWSAEAEDEVVGDF